MKNKTGYIFPCSVCAVLDHRQHGQRRNIHKGGGIIVGG